MVREVGAWAGRCRSELQGNMAVTGHAGSHLGDREKRSQDQCLGEKEEPALERGTFENREKKSGTPGRTREKVFREEGLVSHIRCY